MELKILLPFRVFAVLNDVVRLVAETPAGSFGLLPRRLDCVAVLRPGILTVETSSSGVSFVGVDEGLLVKTGPEVTVSVRRAVGGVDLGQLHATVEREFGRLDQRERTVRTVLARLESSFIRRFMEVRHA